MPIPKFDNAPGLVLKVRKNGWQATWQARTDIVKAGYAPRTVAICHVSDNPTDIERAFISDRCTGLQGEMLLFAHAGKPVAAIYDKTIKSLIECYQTDSDSPFHKLRYKSREHYVCLMTRLGKDCGVETVADIKARSVLRWHEGWVGANNHIAMAHGLVGMLRTLLTFGATILECPDCRSAKVTLHDMRFKMSKPRSSVLDARQAAAIRTKAHEMGWHSLALAQAIQFDCMLRQKDVIGEWVPVTEPGVSDVTRGKDKWLMGLRWSEIDGNLVLRHTTSKRGKPVEIPLEAAPMVMEELARLPNRPTSGPVIIYEATGEPYDNYVFRRVWRDVANACGIPKTVKNMDSRAGAISEATDAGADLHHVQHAATHSDISMTQRYSRNGAEKTANVMRIRAEHRKNSA